MASLCTGKGNEGWKIADDPTTSPRLGMIINPAPFGATTLHLMQCLANLQWRVGASGSRQVKIRRRTAKIGLLFRHRLAEDVSPNKSLSGISASAGTSRAWVNKSMQCLTMALDCRGTDIGAVTLSSTQMSSVSPYHSEISFVNTFLRMSIPFALPQR